MAFPVIKSYNYGRITSTPVSNPHAPQHATSSAFPLPWLPSAGTAQDLFILAVTTRNGFFTGIDSHMDRYQVVDIIFHSYGTGPKDPAGAPWGCTMYIAGVVSGELPDTLYIKGINTAYISYVYFVVGNQFHVNRYTLQGMGVSEIIKERKFENQAPSLLWIPTALPIYPQGVDRLFITFITHHNPYVNWGEYFTSVDHLTHYITYFTDFGISSFWRNSTYMDIYTPIGTTVVGEQRYSCITFTLRHSEDIPVETPIYFRTQKQYAVSVI